MFIENTSGYKFGGYTELQWDNSGQKKDKSTFIFSFNNNQKYTARNQNASINCSNNEGPRFGCAYPEIYFKGTLDKGYSYDYEQNTFVTGRALTGGAENWNVKELEVHKITFI